jgi:hypothetical protein
MKPAEREHPGVAITSITRRWTARLTALAVALLLIVAWHGPSFERPLGEGRNAASEGERERARQGTLEAEGEKREGELGPAEPGEWLIAQRGLTQEAIAGGAFRRATAAAEVLAKRTSLAAPTIASTQWRLVGPTSVGGRVLDIAVDPVEAGTVYAATANGGVWKSTDAGDTFTSVWPDRVSQAIGALAIGSDGTLYAGTGESGPGGGSLSYGGTGVYRSRDRGKTWQSVGLGSSARIGRIAVDPGNPKRAFVAASGDLFVPGGQRGLYRTTDGGDTWSLVLAGANATTGAVDVVIDPTDPSRLWAATWDHRREPDLRRYGGPGSGVYRSTDGGTTWQKLAGGLPASDASLGRIGLTASPLVSGLVYAIAIGTDGGLLGLYISPDGGDTWVSSPGSAVLATGQSTYGWWFSRVWVDPMIPTRLFAAGVELFESLDGGLTWVPQVAALSTVHADQHAMAWDPKSVGRVYLGNDGGFYRGELDALGGLTWTEATYEPFTQFYSVDVAQTDPSRVVGGAQDNGSLRSYGGGGAPDGWNPYYGGDGQANVIDYRNQNRVYACLQYGECARSVDGGNTMTSFTNATTSARRNWFSPVEFDPSDPSIVYYGGNILNRSRDFGITWRPISPDLAATKGRDTQYPFGTLTTVAAAKTDGKVLYAGTDDGRVWSFHDSWVQARDARLPKRWVTRVAVDPTDARLAYATFSGFRSGVRSAAVFRTRDGGATWSNVSGDLPNAPVNDIVVVAERLYVATDVGVFVSGDGGAHWFSVGSLPLTPIMDIRYHAPSKTLYAATFGRGIYAAAVGPVVLGTRIAKPPPQPTPTPEPQLPGETLEPPPSAQPTSTHSAAPEGEGPPPAAESPHALPHRSVGAESRGGQITLAALALLVVAIAFRRVARRT